jgi:single-stranded-DNA-specific exonuclease
MAARLLLASDEAMGDEARALADQLNTENLRRQQEEAEIVAQAKKIVETDLEIGSRTVIVVAGDGWHRGVIGIVASKLVDAFQRPAIVISIDGDLAHGSCRSIPSFNMLGALESCELMTKFAAFKEGGGGMTPEHAGCAPWDRGTRTAAWPDDLRPRLWTTGRRAPRMSEQVVAGISLAPFGTGNPARCSARAASRSSAVPRMGNHLKMSFKRDGRVLRHRAAGVGGISFVTSTAPPSTSPSRWSGHVEWRRYLGRGFQGAGQLESASPWALCCSLCASSTAGW